MTDPPDVSTDNSSLSSNTANIMTANESSSTLDAVEFTKSGKKKRKSYYIRKYPIPKLLKRDIRWDIPNIVTNVLNSRNDALVSSFFHRVCFPTCTFIDSVPKPATPNSIKPIKYDIESMIDIINVDLSMFPDLVMQLKHAEIVTTKITGSKIVLYYEMKGTKIFQNSHDNIEQCCMPATMVNVTGQEEEEIIDDKDDKEEVVHIDINAKDYVPHPQPFQLSMSPRISINLDEQNIVHSIEYALTPGTDVIKTALESAFDHLCLA